MMVTIEKMDVAGTLLTPFGKFTMLKEGFGDELMVFPVVDDEGFQNNIIVRGSFVIIPDVLNSKVDVKRVLTEEEAQKTNIPSELLPETID